MKLPFHFGLLLAVCGVASLVAIESEDAVLPPPSIELDPMMAGLGTGPQARRSTAPYDDTRTVRRGDTLMALLVEAKVPARKADAVIRAMKKVYDPRRIRPGQDVTLTFQPHKDGNGTASKTSPRFLGLRLGASVEREIEVAARGKEFHARAIDRPLTRIAVPASGRIESSLYLTGLENGLPPAILADLIHIFSFEIDFQRDIRRGDDYELLYEEIRDEKGAVVKSGEILMAAVTANGKTTRLYRFKAADGSVGYFDAGGRSSERALLRTPIDGARLSSGYGRRRHPILGYTRMHRGLDFAAQRGTPIYAAGDGVVEYAGRNGGYGKYVRLRHGNNYKTAYAHMRRYGHGIRRGRRVRQGQVIGYVGSTGVSTGPHLHYEVHRGGRSINPRRLKLPSGRKLKGPDLARFESRRRLLDRRHAILVEADQLAGTPSGDE